MKNAAQFTLLQAPAILLLPAAKFRTLWIGEPKQSPHVSSKVYNYASSRCFLNFLLDAHPIHAELSSFSAEPSLCRHANAKAEKSSVSPVPSPTIAARFSRDPPSLSMQLSTPS